MTNYRLYNFKAKVKINSVHEKLINFLKEKDGDSNERERVLQALSAYWLPLALIEANSFSEKEIALHGLAALQRLQQQINFLSLVLSLQAPTYSHVFAANLVTEPATPLTNGKDSRAQVRRQETVKPYTKTEEVESTHCQTLDFAENDLDSLEETALPSDTSHIDKLFGL